MKGFPCDAGALPRQSGSGARFCNQVERMRLLADYTGEEIDPDRARWVVERAAAFLCAIKDAFGPD